MKKLISVCGLGVIATLFGGCASIMKDAALARAPFDLNCSKEKIELTDLGNRTWGAQGCGRRATYVFEDECAGLGACKAILNSSKANEAK